MLPIQNENLIVGIKYKNEFHWYVADKYVWLLSLNNVKNMDSFLETNKIQERRDILDALQNTDAYMSYILQYQVSVIELKSMMKDIVSVSTEYYLDFAPSLYIDFDNHVFYAGDTIFEFYKEYLSKNITFVIGDFLGEINETNYYWDLK